MVANIVFGAIAVALFFAVMYYRSQWLNTSAISEAKDEKIEVIEKVFAEGQAAEALEDKNEASKVDSRAGAVEFLKDSFDKN